ncbi:MAG: hypothetical protein ACRDSL_24280 [Pseudonocardiaceae bacterium]
MGKVVVSIAEDHLGELSAVVTRMRDAGLVVDNVQEVLGTVTGSIDVDGIPRLETVPGVAVVERQRGFQLPPPDAEVQ